jgi:hypothetical protein
MPHETDKFIYKSDTDVASYEKMVNMENVDKAAIQLVVNSITGTSVQAKLQHSLDGTNWEDVSGSTTTALTGAGADLKLSSGQFLAGLVKLVVTMVGVTALDHEVYIVGHHH